MHDRISTDAQRVSLAEAASILGVSKATLRNWDKAGKLNAIRHPVNGYRLYDLEELKQLQDQIGLPLDFVPQEPDARLNLFDIRAVKRVVGKLHDVLRDADSQSNIIGRFDEITKLIFAKALADRCEADRESPFRGDGNEKKTAQRIRSFYHDLALKNPEIIPERFDRLQCSDSAIIDALNVLRAFDFGAACFDFKGVAYEEVIRNTFDKGDHQQFFTPPHIVDFIVSACSEFVQGDVCDPAAGTGGFLASVARQGLSYTSLTAIEIDERLSWVAGMNLHLHEAHDIKSLFLPNGGTLGNEAKSLFECFDTVITNPPFGSDFNDRDSLEAMDLGRGRTSRRRGILFIERCHKLLRSHGTLAIIIDEGVLNLSHALDVRRFITNNFDIEAVISLPETAFMPYATVNASILILRKQRRTDGSCSCFFARADTVGRKPSGDEDIRYDREGSSFVNSDLPDILTAWKNHLAGSPSPIHFQQAYITNVLDNLAKDTNGHRLDFQYHHPSRRLSEKLLESCPFPLLRLGDICAERNKTLVPSEELPDTTITYTGLAHIESGTGVAQQELTPTNSLKSGVKRYEPGDIVFAKMRPGLRKVALMKFEEGGYVSPECSVFTPRPDDSGCPMVDPLLLSVLLRSDFVFGQIMHLVAGIGRPRISSNELREVLIPMVPKQHQERIRAAYLDRIAQARTLRERASEMLGEADSVLKESLLEVAGGFSRGSV